jgi:hypothetical protein
MLPVQEISTMTKYFRIGMTAALLAGAAIPALAQTPAPAAATQTTTSAPDAMAPNAMAPNAMAPDAAATAAPEKAVKKTHHVRKHHAVAQKKPAAGTTKDPAPAN